MAMPAPGTVASRKAAAAVSQAARLAASGHVPPPPSAAQRGLEWTTALRLRVRHVTQWVRKQVRLGTDSNYVCAVYVGMFLYAGWRIFWKILLPWRESSSLNTWQFRIPFVDSHNAMFGMPQARLAAFEPSSVAGEKNIQRPGCVGSVASETCKDTDITVYQMLETDEEKAEDYYLRSVHYLRSAKEEKEMTPEERKKARKKGMLGSEVREGEQVIHGIAKCTAITPNNNCVLDPSSIESEVVRKQLLSLGPLFMLRYPLDIYVPRRFSQAKEKRQDMLVLGLGGTGALTQFFNRHFPHYFVDVVEPDAAKLRLARKYLGFQERHGMKCFISDPNEFLKQTHAMGKQRYDAIFMDILNEAGDMPRRLCSLEFLSNLKDSLTDRGIAVAVLPNHDDKKMGSMVANWRMAFDGRTVVLLHCQTSRHTVLMTFADAGGRGHPQYGEAHDVEEFKELVRAQLSHFKRRMPFDLLSEAHKGNFQQLKAGEAYVFRGGRAVEKY